MTKRSTGPAGASIVSDDGKRIKELTGRLRKMSNDSKFTNEDREEVSKKLKELLGGSEKKSTKPIIDDDLKNVPKFINALIERGKIYSKKDPRIPRKPNPINRAKGGEVKGYMGGGEVHMDDSPNSGMITQRGWGASRKT